MNIVEPKTTKHNENLEELPNFNSKFVNFVGVDDKAWL